MRVFLCKEGGGPISEIGVSRAPLAFDGVEVITDHFVASDVDRAVRAKLVEPRPQDRGLGVGNGTAVGLAVLTG